MFVIEKTKNDKIALENKLNILHQAALEKVQKEHEEEICTG